MGNAGFLLVTGFEGIAAVDLQRRYDWIGGLSGHCVVRDQPP